LEIVGAFGGVYVWVLGRGFVRDEVAIVYDVIRIRADAKPVFRDPQAYIIRVHLSLL